jgi:hypothetical protein
MSIELDVDLPNSNPKTDTSHLGVRGFENNSWQKIGD